MTSSAAFRVPSVSMAKETAETTSASAPLVLAPQESDEALMVRVCAGDKEALALLFRRYAHLVHGMAYKALRDRSEADDFVQDLFLLVYRLCKTFDSSKGSARSWILQMAYRRAISRRRYLTSRQFYTHLDIDDVSDELRCARTNVIEYEDTIEGVLGKGTAQKVFEVLSENQRWTLRLFFFEGYTLDEIAVKLDQPRTRVKNHYFRGLNRLRRAIFAEKSSQGENT